MTDNGVVLTGVNDVAVPNDAAVTDAPRASQPSTAEVFSGRGPRYAQLCDGVSGADIDMECS